MRKASVLKVWCHVQRWGFSGESGTMGLTFEGYILSLASPVFLDAMGMLSFALPLSFAVMVCLVRASKQWSSLSVGCL